MRAQFKAATWNVFYGTEPEAVREVISDSLDRGVSLWLLQEISKPAQRAAVRDLGLRVTFTPKQYAVAWDPDLWVPVRFEPLRLGGPWMTKATPGNPSHEAFSDAHSQILSDLEGRTLTALSYHTPAHIQVPDPPQRRLQATRDSMAALKAHADAAQTRACLFGGDDNVDERLRFGPWDFMLQRATGLRQVTAPRGTHGSIRRIDDFRVRGLKPVGDGRVVNTPSDHHIYEQRFAW